MFRISDTRNLKILRYLSAYLPSGFMYLGEIKQNIMPPYICVLLLLAIAVTNRYIALPIVRY